MERDRMANAALEELGWTVLRFWDFDVEKNLELCLEAIDQALHRRAAAGSPPESRAPDSGT
jgi:very-short-patch-repair endonuclease